MLAPGSTRHIQIVADLEPIRIQYQSANVTDQEFRDFLEGQTETFAEGRRRKAAGQDNRGIMICDSAPDVALTPTQRKLQAEWLDKHHLAIKATSPVTFLVVSNTLRRGVMTAVLWLVSTPVEVRTAPTLERAAELAVERAKLEGLQLPESILQAPGAAARASLDRALNPSVRKTA